MPEPEFRTPTKEPPVGLSIPFVSGASRKGDHETMTEELLYEARQKITTTTVREFTPEGARVSYNMQGEVKGKYNAARIESVDGLLRPDGTTEFEGRIIELTNEGETILIPLKGTGKVVGPTEIQVHGTETFMTRSQKYAWLNTARGRFEGTINPLTGEVAVKGFSSK